MISFTEQFSEDNGGFSKEGSNIVEGSLNIKLGSSSVGGFECSKYSGD